MGYKQKSTGVLPVLLNYFISNDYFTLKLNTTTPV